ncbi:MAG: hypothetical protein JHC26_04780, partial [Thermofilum sp.]|nr:hypothetical protein [Thermofilum sp.]
NAFDVLKKAAIKPPQIVQLASELRKKGVDINALTVEEALQEILKHYKGLKPTLSNFI